MNRVLSFKSELYKPEEGWCWPTEILYLRLLAFSGQSLQYFHILFYFDWLRSSLIQRRASFDRTRFLQWSKPITVAKVCLSLFTQNLDSGPKL